MARFIFDMSAVQLYMSLLLTCFIFHTLYIWHVGCLTLYINANERVNIDTPQNQGYIFIDVYKMITPVSVELSQYQWKSLRKQIGDGNWITPSSSLPEVLTILNQQSDVGIQTFLLSDFKINLPSVVPMLEGVEQLTFETLSTGSYTSTADVGWKSPNTHIYSKDPTSTGRGKFNTSKIICKKNDKNDFK